MLFLDAFLTKQGKKNVVAFTVLELYFYMSVVNDDGDLKNIQLS